MIHLLHKSQNPRTGQVVGAEHLKLEEFLKNTFCDDVTSNYVAGILCAPLLSKEDILYRQELVRVFYQNSVFLYAFVDVLGKMDVVYADWQKVKKDYAMLTRSSQEPGYAQWSYLKENVRYLLKIRQGILQTEALLASLPKDSGEVLLPFVDFLKQALQLMDQYDVLLTALSRGAYEHMDMSICIEINSMAEVLRLTMNTGGKKNVGRLLSDGNANLLFSEAIRHTNQVILLINEGFFRLFHRCGEEMLFYRFAVRYMKLLEDTCIPYVFPAIEDDREMLAANFYDPFLVAQGRTNRIVPRQISMEQEQSVILTGDNNTGKTFYLRSLAYLQLFAQAGLPVGAKAARVGVRENIYILFAGKEGGQSRRDMGLFEMDVMALAPIVHSVQPGDLVLLNEVFQATFYDEAALALYPILEYFRKKHAQFFLVTHIESLLSHYTGEEVLLLQAGEDFVVREKTVSMRSQ